MSSSSECEISGGLGLAMAIGEMTKAFRVGSSIAPSKNSEREFPGPGKPKCS